MEKFKYTIGVLVLLTIYIIILQNTTVVERVKKEILTTESKNMLSNTATIMKITSNAFQQDQSIPSVHTCDGLSMSPELNFVGVPVEAKSLVLLMDDPDVPKSLRADGVFDHWVIYDIDPSTTFIPEGKFVGTEGKNGSGKIGYIGPCPPDREHRYFFKLYALDMKLGFAEGKTKKEVLEAIEEHIISSAELIGRYDRMRGN